MGFADVRDELRVLVLAKGGLYTFVASASGSNPFRLAGCSLGISQRGRSSLGVSMLRFHIIFGL